MFTVYTLEIDQSMMLYREFYFGSAAIFRLVFLRCFFITFAYLKRQRVLFIKIQVILNLFFTTVNLQRIKQVSILFVFV